MLIHGYVFTCLYWLHQTQKILSGVFSPPSIYMCVFGLLYDNFAQKLHHGFHQIFRKYSKSKVNLTKKVKTHFQHLHSQWLSVDTEYNTEWDQKFDMTTNQCLHVSLLRITFSGTSMLSIMCPRSSFSMQICCENFSVYMPVLFWVTFVFFNSTAINWSKIHNIQRI